MTDEELRQVVIRMFETGAVVSGVESASYVIKGILPNTEDYEHWYCGNCGCRINLKTKPRYCCKCGVRIDWTERKQRRGVNI